MNFTYKQLYDWLIQFPQGKSFAHTFSTVIEPGKELGSLIQVDESYASTIQIYLIVFNEDFIISGEYLDNRSDFTNNFVKTLIYRTHDVISKEIHLSDTISNFAEIQFSTSNYLFTFQDGKELEISKKDFPNQTIAILLAL